MQSIQPDPTRRHLARAIAIAGPAGVVASPNPAVGCVLVRDGRVVAEGVTAAAGGAHAEVVALRAAGPAARGAAAYVTLEPCVHHGRTPPCVDALVAAGVARVSFVHADPNPAARGGAAALRAAGVAVAGPLRDADPLRSAVAGQLEGFLHVIGEGRPHLTLKLAQALDGGLQPPADRRWVTGRAARRAVHRWRATRDAVLVGSGTVLADDPRLDARGVGAARQPRAVVLDARVRTPVTARVARRGTIVVTVDDADPDRVGALRDVGVEVLTVGPGRDGGVDPAAALAALARVGVTSVLAEPGPRLARALVAASLVDRLVVHVAVGSGTPPLRLAVDPPPAHRWGLERIGGAGDDAILHAVPVAAGLPRDRPGPVEAMPAGVMR